VALPYYSLNIRLFITKQFAQTLMFRSLNIPVLGKGRLHIWQGLSFMASSCLSSLYFILSIAISITTPNNNPADMNNIISSISLPLVSLIRRLASWFIHIKKLTPAGLSNEG
jgi:hypothetical protein